VCAMKVGMGGGQGVVRGWSGGGEQTGSSFS
jgi:hypothetical protein